MGKLLIRGERNRENSRNGLLSYHDKTSHPPVDGEREAVLVFHKVGHEGPAVPCQPSGEVVPP
jgi:hypothetical protein